MQEFLTDYPFFEKEGETSRTKGNLPHWNQKNKIYFITFRLGDSLPLDVLRRYEEYCKYQEHVIETNGGLPEDWKRYEVEKHNKVLNYLDKGYGSCLLKQSAVRKIVVDTLHFFDGDCCLIHDYVIMPNHVHLLVEMLDDASVTDMIGRVKKFSARTINKLLNRKGKLWQYECFDRIVRSEYHYLRSVRYIALNPYRLERGTYTLHLLLDHESMFNIRSVE